MSISQSFSGLARASRGRPAASGVYRARTWLYLAILAFGMSILAAPPVVVFGLQRLFDLPQPLFMPLSAAILAVDLYLAAWLSRLFAAMPRRLPPRADWRLPAGMGWKLAVVLLIAPWPFNLAFVVAGDHPQIYLQLAVILLATAVALGCLAVLFAVLLEAWRLVRPRPIA
jgi:hypothetical protein